MTELPKSAFGRLDWCRLDFDSLREVVHEGKDRLHRLHAPLEEAIRELTLKLEDLPTDDDSALWRDSVIETESPVLEDLLGIAFTIAQTQIKAVESGVRRLSKLLCRERQRSIPNLNEILMRGRTLPNEIHEIEFANAVANFWKHSAEWDWEVWKWYEERPEAQGATDGKIAARTAKTLRGSGMQSGSTGQMQTLATFFGILDFRDLSPLRTAVDGWGWGLVREIDREFGLDQATSAHLPVGG
jgi:hypothetical protein